MNDALKKVLYIIALVIFAKLITWLRTLGCHRALFPMTIGLAIIAVVRYRQWKDEGWIEDEKLRCWLKKDE
jgi:hypothetical protein